MNRLLNEPTVIAGAIRAIILAGTAFGLQWSAEQVAALMFAVEAVLTVINRALVTPNQLAEARVAAGGSPTVPRNS
jgi:hypothetical protein